MFLKVVRSGNYQYLRLMESTWKGGKATQRIILNLGRLDHLQKSETLYRLGKRFLALDGTDLPSIRDLREQERLCYGDRVYKVLWDRYRFTDLLQDLIRDRRVQFHFVQTVYLMVMDRLLAPRSKLATFQHQSRYLGWDQVALEHLYRCLDLLADGKGHLEEILFSRYRNLFNGKVDVVFYDVTTYHFESVREDELRKFGFSKVGKSHEVQVVMGLLMDLEGHPIGFDLFPGNTHDSQTLLVALEKLERRFQLRRIILVADQGVYKKEHLGALREAGYEYIIRLGLKNASEKIQSAVLDPSGYCVLKNDNENRPTFTYKWLGDHRQRYRDSEGNWRVLTDRVLVSWSAKVAWKEQADRDRQVKKAQEVLDGKRSLPVKGGYRRYLVTEGSDKAIGLNEKQIHQDAVWEGYRAIQTNAKQFPAQQILEAYHQLWQIERAFRVLKSTLEARPIYHWTPRRIVGHFVLCFLAFVLERDLERRVKQRGLSVSPERIQEALNTLEVSRIRLGKQEFYLKGKHDPLAGKMVRLVGMKPLKNVLTDEEVPRLSLP